MPLVCFDNVCFGEKHSIIYNCFCCQQGTFKIGYSVKEAQVIHRHPHIGHLHINMN